MSSNNNVPSSNSSGLTAVQSADESSGVVERKTASATARCNTDIDHANLLTSASSSRRLDRWPYVSFIGDSLTEFGFSPDGRWLARVADKLSRRADVRVRGFSGYTSRWWRTALPLLLPQCPPDAASRCAACVVWLGANDSSRGAAKPTLHVPLDEFVDNVDWIVGQLMSRLQIGPQQMLLVNIPPVDEAAYKRDCEASGFPFDKFLADCGPYNAALEQVARLRGIELADVFTALAGQTNWQQFFSDGVHFSASGSDRVFDCVWPALERRLLAYSTISSSSGGDALPVMLPDYETAASDGFDEALAEWGKQTGCAL